jgi:hypothetical protein
MAALSYEEKIKTYIRVAITLGIITIVEVGLTFVPHDEQPMKFIITMAIVLLSCSKAFFVGYYYMHLNHEKKWTKIVAVAPLCMVVFTGALIADLPVRPISRYVAEPERGEMYPTKESLELRRLEEEKRALEKKNDLLDFDDEDSWD